MGKRSPPKERASRTSIFQMPLPQSMAGRTSSITNAFVNSIIPVIQPTLDEVRGAIEILEMDEHDVRCAYCGDPSTEWDHLRPLVLNQRPTGFVSEIANLVPACGKCNQSKGNKDWRSWMLGPAERSPASRGIRDIADRIRRLETYMHRLTPRHIDFKKTLGPERWSGYWLLWEKMVGELRNCQKVADELRTQIRASLNDSGDSPS